MDMEKKTWIIVDVGCIECEEPTQLRGVFHTEDEATEAWNKICEELKAAMWVPGWRSRVLEEGATTYLLGANYFTGGQHYLELHVWPPYQPDETLVCGR